MYEMTVRLRTGTGERLYEQIYGHIKKEIREGKLLAGERLPSTRFLADYLQVSRSTVDYAYGQLLAEGYIESRPCRGYFVCSMEELFQLKGQDKDKHPEMSGDMVPGTEGGTAGRGEAPEELSEGGTTGKGIRWDFSPYDIDMSGFPFSVWKKITKNILTYANSDLFSRGEAQGDHGLRITISRYLHSSDRKSVV